MVEQIAAGSHSMHILPNQFVLLRLSCQFIDANRCRCRSGSRQSESFSILLQSYTLFYPLTRSLPDQARSGSSWCLQMISRSQKFPLHSQKHTTSCQRAKVLKKRLARRWPQGKNRKVSKRVTSDWWTSQRAGEREGGRELDWW